MFCSNCGAKLEEGTVFCPKCGTKVEEGDGYSSGDVSVQDDSADPVVRAIGKSDDISRYASFWQRAGAYIIDLVIVNILTFVIVLLLVVLGASGLLNDDGSANVVGLIIGWLYFALLQSSSRQATFGKQLLGLKVVDLHYDRISFARATGRFFSKILSILILFIGFIMVLFTKKRQALHDMIAGTYVLGR